VNRSPDRATLRISVDGRSQKRRARAAPKKGVKRNSSWGARPVGAARRFEAKKAFQMLSSQTKRQPQQQTRRRSSTFYLLLSPPALRQPTPNRLTPRPPANAPGVTRKPAQPQTPASLTGWKASSQGQLARERTPRSRPHRRSRRRGGIVRLDRPWSAGVFSGNARQCSPRAVIPHFFLRGDFLPLPRAKSVALFTSSSKISSLTSSGFIALTRFKSVSFGM
jgi:hypothetical protein